MSWTMLLWTTISTMDHLITCFNVIIVLSEIVTHRCNFGFGILSNASPLDAYALDYLNVSPFCSSALLLLFPSVPRLLLSFYPLCTGVLPPRFEKPCGFLCQW